VTQGVPSKKHSHGGEDDSKRHRASAFLTEQTKADAADKRTMKLRLSCRFDRCAGPQASDSNLCE